MGILWKIIGWALSVSGLLVQGGTPQIRVVTAIQVEAGGETYSVTDPETMEAMMHYLRRLDPYTTAEIAPETFRAEVTELTVSYSDGAETHYTQLYTEYLQTDGGPWKKIDPEDGARLWPILACISEESGI
jgi:hypothetical protein